MDPRQPIYSIAHQLEEPVAVAGPQRLEHGLEHLGRITASGATTLPALLGTQASVISRARVVGVCSNQAKVHVKRHIEGADVSGVLHEGCPKCRSEGFWIAQICVRHGRCRIHGLDHGNGDAHGTQLADKCNKTGVHVSFRSTRGRARASFFRCRIGA